MDLATARSPAAPKRPRGRPRKTLGERDDGNRRRALIVGAARLFRRKGFAATSTRDIAAAAGMQSGSPFYHFKSKGALLYAVMEEGMRSAILRQQAALDGAPASAQDRLRLLVRNHFDILLGPGSDFIPVMLYESRSITARQLALLAQLRRGARRAVALQVRDLESAGARQSAAFQRPRVRAGGWHDLFVSGTVQ